MSRQQMRQAVGVLQAINDCFSGSVGADWFAAIAETEGEGKALYNRHTAMSHLER